MKSISKSISILYRNRYNNNSTYLIKNNLKQFSILEGGKNFNNSIKRNIKRVTEDNPGLFDDFKALLEL